MRKTFVGLAALAIASTTLTLAFTPNATADKSDKIWICHATGSEKNPYVRIKVDASGLNGHGDHADDIIPAPEGGCPDSPPTPEPSPSPTETPTESPSPSPTETPTESPSPSPTETPTTSPSPSPTETPTTSPSPESTTPPSVPGPAAPPVRPSAPPSVAPGTPEPPVDPCATTTQGRTATGFVKFKYFIRPAAQADIDAFADSLTPGSCVQVYGFAGFNAKQWALDISERRARAVAGYLEDKGFTTKVVIGLSKDNAARLLGWPLAHNRMVVLIA